MNSPSAADIRSVLWRFAPAVYGPTLLFGLGEGAVIPLIPILAVNLGASIPVAAFVAATLVFGGLAGAIPAGAIVARFGERVTMIGGSFIALLAAAGLAVASNLWVLGAASFVLGFSGAAFTLARHAFMTMHVPYAFRARSLALLGGTMRLGMFIGPFVAAALLAAFHDQRATVWFLVVCLAAMVVLLVVAPDPETALAAPASSEPAPERLGVMATIGAYRGVLARLGVAAALLSALRSARPVVLPLWGIALGLDASAIALVVGLSGAVDFALFYASGQVMDRFGRLAGVLPATLIMGSGFLTLALTGSLVSADAWFTALAIFIGVGNGLSSGILMTLGSDLAPQENPGPFLGAYRTIAETGAAGAPLLISAIAAAASLPAAVAVIGCLGLLGAAAFARWVPRYVPRR